MSLRYGLLGILNYKSMTGYELDAFVKKTISFFWDAKTSQIYRELANMEKEGWLSSNIEIQTDRPNKKVYSITEEGRKNFKEWLAHPEQDIEQIIKTRDLMMMRVFFGGEGEKSDTEKLLTLCRDRYSELSENLSKSRDTPIENSGHDESLKNREFYWKMTAEYGKIYYKAVAEWTNKMLKLMEEF